MKLSGKIKDIQFSLSGKPLLILEINEKVDLINQAPALQDIERLDIEVKKHREKRSLNANSYFHVLCEKMAAVLNTKPIRVKNQMILDYGKLDRDEDGNIRHVIMRDDIEYLDIEFLHLRPTQKISTLDNGETYRVYLIMRGSHTYDSKEMADLIDGAVEEAKALGIQTLTPDQIARMKATWKGE